MKPLTILTTTLLAIALLYGLFQWMQARDEAIAQGAQAYEECVKREFGTTPSAWYNEQGEYPVCNN